MAGGEALLMQVCRQGGEQVVEHRIGPRLCSRQIGGHGRIDLDVNRNVDDVRLAARIHRRFLMQDARRRLRPRELRDREDRGDG